MHKVLAILALIFAALFAAPSLAHAQQQAYRLDPSRAALNFRLTQWGVPVRGSFESFDAALAFDRAHPQDADLSVEIQAASLDAGHATGAMLRAFEAEQHPLIRFVSTKIELGENGAARILGLLTLRGVTHPIVLNASVSAADPLTFNASGSFRRSAFGIKGWPFASDRIQLTIAAPFMRR